MSKGMIYVVVLAAIALTFISIRVSSRNTTVPDDNNILFTISNIISTSITTNDKANTNDNNGCKIELPAGPLIINNSLFKVSEKFLDFSTGPALKDEKSFMNTNQSAVCLYRHELLHSNHFPHAMQQLYRCVSWWLAHSNASSRILLVNNTKFANGSVYSPFMGGFMKAIQEAMNVTIIVLPYNMSEDVNGTRFPYIQLRGFQSYVMQNPLTDARTMREYFGHHYNLLPRRFGHDENDNNTNRSGFLTPRIGILDRTKSERRNILNSKRLRYHLQQKLGLPENYVTVQYFSEATFLQQIQFFMENDIVISPHGAQLTAVPFMPPTCGTLLELFPAGYYIPGFFGSLANTSNLKYTHIYLSNLDGNEEYNSIRHDTKLRHKARGVSLCLPIKSMVKAVTQLVVDWKRCRQTYLKFE